MAAHSLVTGQLLGPGDPPEDPPEEPPCDPPEATPPPAGPATSAPPATTGPAVLAPGPGWKVAPAWPLSNLSFK